MPYKAHLSSLISPAPYSVVCIVATPCPFVLQSQVLFWLQALECAILLLGTLKSPLPFPKLHLSPSVSLSRLRYHSF